MTEVGVQAMTREESKIPFAIEQCKKALIASGVPSGDIRVEQEFRHWGPSHDSPLHPDCPYSVFAATHPGADKDVYPVCGVNEHWLDGYSGWIVNAWGDAPDD